MHFRDFLESSRSNAHLSRAKANHDDEFYTSYADAGLMISPFAGHLRGKAILCNCDDPDKSQTFAFLKANFTSFGLRRLICIGYVTAMSIVTSVGEKRIPVKNGGDFRKGESLAALDKCDVVVSNPPFSRGMFSEFINLAMKKRKDILAIGPLLGVKSADVKPWILSGKLHAIKSPYQKFDRPSHAISSATEAQVAVFTTFPDDPFSGDLNFSHEVKFGNLPDARFTDAKLCIGKTGNMSYARIPYAPHGSKLIVPIGVFRKRWRDHFKLLDIFNTVMLPDGRIAFPCALLEYK